MSNQKPDATDRAASFIGLIVIMLALLAMLFGVSAATWWLAHQLAWWQFAGMNTVYLLGFSAARPALSKRRARRKAERKALEILQKRAASFREAR